MKGRLTRRREEFSGLCLLILIVLLGDDIDGGCRGCGVIGSVVVLVAQSWDIKTQSFWGYCNFSLARDF